MSESVEGIFCRSLRLIQLSEPIAYAAIAERLDGMTLRLNFDSFLILAARDGEIFQTSEREKNDIVVAGDRSIVIDLVHGRISLTKAVYLGKVEVTGAIGKLTCALSASEYFIAALLRIDEAEELVKALEA
ncbi:MAG: hypothetical protein AAF387_15480 [Pseudomonadota bacterium]